VAAAVEPLLGLAVTMSDGGWQIAQQPQPLDHRRWVLLYGLHVPKPPAWEPAMCNDDNNRTGQLTCTV